MSEIQRRTYEEIAASLESFTRSDQRLMQPDIDAVYDQQWVAAHDGEIVAWSTDLQALMEILDERAIPRGNTAVRFIGAPVIDYIFL